jgi:hypothetical protein
MEVFRDLYVKADADTMASAIAEMEKSLPAGWSRDKAAEDRIKKFSDPINPIFYCFACQQEKRRPAAMLVLAQKDAETFYVSNILPLERGQLKRPEYNRVLEEFYDRIFKPHAEKVGLPHKVTEPEADLHRWMDEATAKLLRSFSARANKATGASHHSDRERWNAFVLSAHRSGSKLDSSTLKRWLVEAEDWSPDIAQELAIEYESGRDLLDYAFSH